MASDIYLKVGELFSKWFKMRIAAGLVGLNKSIAILEIEQPRFIFTPISPMRTFATLVLESQHFCRLAGILKSHRGGVIAYR